MNDREPDPYPLLSEEDMAKMMGIPSPEPYSVPIFSAVLLACSVLLFGGGVTFALAMWEWLPLLIGVVGAASVILAALLYASAVAPANRHHKRR